MVAGINHQARETAKPGNGLPGTDITGEAAGYGEPEFLNDPLVAGAVRVEPVSAPGSVKRDRPDGNFGSETRMEWRLAVHRASAALR
jgi:hypothetical protein